MREQGKRLLSRYGLVVSIYLLATSLTDAPFMGDTADYIDSVIKGVEFWEFGHVCWRPLGWLVLQIFHAPVAAVVGPDRRAQTTPFWIAVVWLAGLLIVILLQALSVRFRKRRTTATLVTAAFIFAQAF